MKLHSSGSKRCGKILILLGISVGLPYPLLAADLIIPKYTSSGDVAFVIGLLALGVLLGLFAYTLFLAISTKETMFVYFSIIVFLLTILQTFAAYDRFLFQLTYNRVTIITHLLFITFLLFFEDFFSLARHRPRLSGFNRISLYVIAGYTIVFVVLKFMFPEAANLHSVLDFIRELFVFYTNILFITTIVLSMSWMKSEALMLLIAFIPPALLTSINAMNIFEFMHRYQTTVTFLMQYNQPIGLSLQGILFSLAMANRYNRLKLARQISEQESERLRRIDHEKTEFFMNMSHETRTPLTIIMGMTSQLRQGKFGNSIKANDGILAAIERNSMRLLRHVTHLLRLGRPLQTAAITAIPVARQLQQMVQEFSIVAQNKHIRLSYIQDDTINFVSVFLSYDDIEIILMNLLSNSLKFNPEGGSVTVRAYLDENKSLVIEVKDTGCGMSEDMMLSIFERYSSYVHPTDQIQTGLGLSIVKSIMDNYGGMISCKSLLDKGSTFTLTFPPNLIGHYERSQTDSNESLPRLGSMYTMEFSDQPEINQYDIERITSDEKSPTILVVEDDPDMLAYIRMVLQPHYQVIGANSPEEGLHHLELEQIDLIVSDIMMGTINGHEFLKMVRQHTKDNPIPLIFLTARESVEEQIESLHEGALRYITKPFSPDMLIAGIETILNHDKELIRTKVDFLRKGIDSLLSTFEHPDKLDRDIFNEDQFEQKCIEARLSTREIEVAKLILIGKSDKEIASMLNLSPRTIANHNRSIYQKMEVGSRFELISRFYYKGFNHR